MSITILPSNLEKLEHDIQEIRVRALRDVESKISRAILFDDPINCIFPDLLKALIRWFRKMPICEEETVLNLIIVLLSNKYGPEVINYFGTEKIEKEINNIRILLSNSEHDKLLLEIIDILHNFEREKENAILKNNEARKSAKDDLIPEVLIDLTTLDNALDDVLDTDYVKCWNIPGPLELNSLILLKEQLNKNINKPSFKHALKYLHTALRDFPTEYFLQPPYIYKSLVTLLNENSLNCNSEIISLSTQLTKLLLKRKKYRLLTVTYNYVENDSNPYNQISLQKYSFDLIKVIITNFKINVDNVTFVVNSIDLINGLLKLLNFVDITKNNRLTLYVDILNEMASLVRYYRQKYEESACNNNLWRTIYLNLINLLIKFNMCGKSKNSRIHNELSKAVVAERSENFDELKLVLFDVTIRVFYPKMYNIVKTIVGPLDATSHLSSLLALENKIKIPIEIIKNKKVYDEIELIRNGHTILETIYTVKCFNIIKLLFDSICNNIDCINNDDKLSEIAENLFIALLTIGIAESRSLIYKQAGDRIKCFFHSFMDGEIGINKCNLNKNANRLFNLGIPISSQILSEIICFGYKSDDIVINQNSETILTLILRGKTILGNYWNILIDSITSIFPLLQCHAESKTKLGQAIIDLFDPNFDLNEDEIVKGNIRLLFNKNYDVRKIGLMRTFSILKSHPKYDQFLPNIENVHDTVSNDICSITSNLYAYSMYEIDCDVSAVNPLLELLKSNDVQPSVRKSTLMQLNLMAGNSVVNRYIHDNNGWLIAISCLENALLTNHTHEYPDAAIPCIGILTKIALQIPEFRREISKEPNLYFLILRALFVFHLNISLKLDCAVLLFLFLYSDYIIGAKNLTVPFILKNINIPINTEFYRKYNKNSNNITKLDSIFINSQDNTELNSHIMKYFRFIFAYLWFDGKLPTNKTLEYKTKFDFEPKLKLLSADVNQVITTSNLGNLQNLITNIENTTNHENFTTVINCLDLLLLVNNKNVELINYIDLKKLKFYNILPNTVEDENLFIKIINLVNKLLNYTAANDDSLLIKLLHDLMRTDSTFELIMLNSSNYTKNLYTETCLFVSGVLTNILGNYKKITTECTDNCGEHDIKLLRKLLQKWFNIVSQLFNEFYETKTGEFEKLQSLLIVYRNITSNKLLISDPLYNGSIINRLFYFISSTKSLSQSGADFTKHCLFCIGNLICDGVEIKLKYYRLLSSLCGHNDFEIRSCAWGILDKLAMGIDGAENIIKQLIYLPGGIHACCLSTVLDINEVPIVRVLAAGVFSNLISFSNRKCEGLNVKVTPRCKEQVDTEIEDPVKIIEEIVFRQKFFVRVQDSLKYFNVSDILEKDLDQPITTCEVITGYCIVLVNLIHLKEEILKDQNVLSTIYDIAVLLSYVPLIPTRASLDMVVEISRLLSRCFSAKKYPSLLDRISIHDFAIMESLVVVLNLKYFNDYPSLYLNNCCINILLVIRQLTSRKSGYENYCRFWQKDNNASIFLDLLIYCLKCFKSHAELWKAALKFLLSIYTVSQTQEYDFETIVDMFDKSISSKYNELTGAEMVDLTAESEKQNDENLNPNVSREDETKKNIIKFISNPKSKTYDIEVLFKKIIRIFDWLCLKDKPENGVVTWTKDKRLCYQTMQVMLKCSLTLRLFAIKSKFMDKIIVRIGAIYNGLGMTCADYIRRHGDAKKEPIVAELQELINLITYWYSNHIFDDEVQIYNLFRNFLNIWPWTTSNSEIQLKFFNCLLILSEKSIPVCRRISSSYTGTTGCIIQKIIIKVTDETAKFKNPSGNSEFLETSLRLLANCCSCIEGRIQMGKQNVLDNISRLHPVIVKNHKGWNDVLYQWLKFWEIYSRYPEGGALRHIPLICSLIVKTTVCSIRIETLKVIRNMCFINTNRSGILSSPDILYVFRYILEEGQTDEKFIVVTCIWKLIANSSKGKNAIKNSSLPGRLRTILNEIASVHEDLEENEFYNIISITINILDG